MVELESEGELTRREVANFLREFADELDDGVVRDERIRTESSDPSAGGDTTDPKRLTFIVGGDSATVTVPDTVQFDVDVESRSPLLSSGVSQAIDLHLGWEIEDPDERVSGDWVEIE